MILDSFTNKEKILNEFLVICEFDGWTNQALIKALNRCSIEEKFLNLIFENGCLDLAEFYIDYQNKKAADNISKIVNFNQDKIRNKIRFFLYERFEVEKNNKIALQRLANFYSNPKNFISFETGPKPMIKGLTSCCKIADFIWTNIGDQSTDFNFYTKRLTLAKIIFRSLFVFLKDDSINLEKTKNFIDVEIEKIMKFEKYKMQVKNFTKNAQESLKEMLINDEGELKSVKEIVKKLPFVRLIKF